MRINDVLGDAVSHVYLPYDLPWFARRFLVHFKPRLGIIMETEIWPNLLDAANTMNLPMMIANGRLSERSMKGYGYLSSLIGPSLGAVHRIAAQSDQDAERYKKIGARADSIVNCGNIKYDIDWSIDQAESSLALRKAWFGLRKVIVAGSTHPGEETLLIKAFQTICEKFDDALLVLVPRHPERGRAVAELCHAAGFEAQLFSATDDLPPQKQILVIDRVGELRRFYGACEVAYIGGSLVPHGGQNPLEPLVARVPVIFGPYMSNFKSIRNNIMRAKAGIEIKSEAELAQALLTLLEQPEVAQSMGARGQEMVRQNQGALDRIYKITAALLHQPAFSSS